MSERDVIANTEHPPTRASITGDLRSLGIVSGVETFHRVPGVLRSHHPMVSHLAFGPKAAVIVQDHSLADGFGEQSPLARLHDLDATVVLIGVGHANNTTLHLAEHRSSWPGKQHSTQGAPLLVDGIRTWVTFDDLDSDTDDFEAVGAAFAAAGGVRSGPVGAATASVMSQRAIVAFATGWFTSHRPASLTTSSKETT